MDRVVPYESQESKSISLQTTQEIVLDHERRRRRRDDPPGDEEATVRLRLYCAGLPGMAEIDIVAAWNASLATLTKNDQSQRSLLDTADVSAAGRCCAFALR